MGNPPYIFSRELISLKDKDYFNTQFKLNTYILFTELGVKIANSNSSLSYIIPNNWLTLQKNSDFREYILKKGKKIVIINDRDKTFEDASVESSILTFSRQGNSTTVCYEMKEKTHQFISKVENKEYLNSGGSIINYGFYSDIETVGIVKKFLSKSVDMDTYFEVKNGVQAYTVGEGVPKLTKEMKDERVYHSNIKKAEDWKIYYDGSDIKRYNAVWSGQYIKYGINLSRRRTPELFEGDRILVRQIPAKKPYSIVSTFINNESVCDNNYYMVIRPKSDDYYSLTKVLSILNSKPMRYWFVAVFAKNQRKLFPQFKVNELRVFPIPKLNNKLLNKYEIKVNQILSLKKENPKADTTALEREIDQMVYKLYNLTTEEIAIVEAS
ncbi:MAG: TaqI-like C-terminal specificity domain-containing protein [Lacinutrix sp.]|uniref:TaqI-like C-terminal specificity domain-containing protein n=1 Tax=Lacinutrix sp. TaxID=1937692 RepID=UPI0030A0854E